MTVLLRPLLDRVLDLALPAVCPGCGAEGEPLCSACRPALDARLELPAGSPLGIAHGPPDPLLQLEWCAPFSGIVRSVLHALKYAGEQRLAHPVGEAVARRWARAGAGGEILVPVPVHEARRRQRGFDQAELITVVTAAALGIPWLPALVRTRATTAQYHLDRRHRAANVANAFALRPAARSQVEGRWIVLVDDVVTTGSTLVAGATALLETGALTVSAITVARER